MHLLALPAEVLVPSLAFLTARDILAFRRTCKDANELVSGSALLRYLLLLYATGMEDTIRRCSDSLQERLEYLRGRENAWRTLAFSASRKVKVPVKDLLSHIRYLSNGTYVFGELSLALESNRTGALRCCRLPTYHPATASITRAEAYEKCWLTKPLGFEAYNVAVSADEDEDVLIALTSEVTP